MKLSTKQLSFISALLMNDEKSSDDELVEFLQQKFKCSLKIALKVVAKRQAIKDDPLNVEITNKDFR